MAAKRTQKKAASKKLAAKKKKVPAKAKPKAPAKKKPTARTAKKKTAKPARASKAAKAPRTPKPKSRRVKTKPRRRRTPAQLKKLRQQLLDKRKELIQAYQNAKGDSRDRLDDGTEDYIDYAVSSYDREFLLSLTELEQKHLMLVEAALDRIDRAEKFGRCAQCDQEIPDKRLEVQPWARYCVRCQELDEQGLLWADTDDESDDDDNERSPTIAGDVEPDDSEDDTVEEDRILGG